MTERTKKQDAETPIIWEREEPSARPALVPLSREAIVKAAIAIADEKGLTSVSLRKVASALGAGPMRLYGYMSTKGELLELMVDMVYGEMLSAETLDGDWRGVLRSIAHRTRQAAQRHNWFIELLGGRPHFGPNALAFREQSFGALNDIPGFEDIDVAMEALKTVNAYVIGAIWDETSQLRSERESGMDTEEWKAAMWPYMQRMIATGRFPMLTKIVRDATHPSADDQFDRGINCVLDGIEALLAR